MAPKEGDLAGTTRNKSRARIMGNTDVPGEFEQTQVRIKLSGDSCQMVHTDSDHAPVSVRAPSVATAGRKSATKTWKSVFPKQLVIIPQLINTYLLPSLGQSRFNALHASKPSTSHPMIKSTFSEPGWGQTHLKRGGTQHRGLSRALEM